MDHGIVPFERLRGVGVVTGDEEFVQTLFRFVAVLAVSERVEVALIPNDRIGDIPFFVVPFPDFEENRFVEFVQFGEFFQKRPIDGDRQVVSMSGGKLLGDFMGIVFIAQQKCRVFLPYLFQIGQRLVGFALIEIANGQFIRGERRDIEILRRVISLQISFHRLFDFTVDIELVAKIDQTQIGVSTPFVFVDETIEKIVGVADEPRGAVNSRQQQQHFGKIFIRRVTFDEDTAELYHFVGIFLDIFGYERLDAIS